MLQSKWWIQEDKDKTGSKGFIDTLAPVVTDMVWHKLYHMSIWVKKLLSKRKTFKKILQWKHSGDF
jgi:hypothetical protein